MKKLIIGAMLLVSLFLLCSCESVEYFFDEKSLKEIVSKQLSISLEDATVLDGWYEAVGWNGDGEAFVMLSCPDGFEVNLGSKWKVMPLEGEAYQFFNDYIYGGVGFFEHPETDEKVIPDVENGYWYYKERGLSNWDFAIYDSDENILYYYASDT